MEQEVKKASSAGSTISKYFFIGDCRKNPPLPKGLRTLRNGPAHGFPSPVP